MPPSFERSTRSPSSLFVSQASIRGTPIKMEDDIYRFRSFQDIPGAAPSTQARPTPPQTPMPRRVRSQEQQGMISEILTGVNAFVTGAAGSGKSFIIQEVALELRARAKCVRIVAPTGLAASHIDGSTLHSYCSWVPSESQKSIVCLEQKVEFGYAQARFDDTDVLIIDEISMLSNYTFERFSQVMKAARRTLGSPFGGVQIVVLGDFCQWPRVKSFETCFNYGTFMQKRR